MVRNKLTRGRVTFIAVVFACLTAVGLGIYASITESGKIEYPSAVINFDGMHMQMGADGNIQGFLDVSIANINAEAVTFTLVYDKDYLEPSDYETNETYAEFERENPGIFDNENLDIKDVFRFDPSNEFTWQTFNSLTSLGGIKDEESTVAVSINTYTEAAYQAEDEYITYNGTEYERYEDFCNAHPYLAVQRDPGYNEEDDDDDKDTHLHYEILADTSEGLKIGSLSFRVNDPEALAKLSYDDLKNKVLKVEVSQSGVENVGFIYYSNVPLGFTASTAAPAATEDPDATVDPDVTAAPAGTVSPQVIRESDGMGEYNIYVQNVHYNWLVTTDVYDAEPLEKEITLLAPQVYYDYEPELAEDGTEIEADAGQYLLSYLNKYHNKVLVKHTDYIERIYDITWGNEDDHFVMRRTDREGAEPDHKGGTYELIQYYNGVQDSYHAVTMKVNVETVSLVDFSADRDYISKTYDDKTKAPETDAELDLPPSAYGITDHVYDLIHIERPIAAGDWTHTPVYTHDSSVDTSGKSAALDLKDDRNTDGAITLKANIDISELEDDYPWLTVPADSYSINAYRYAGAKTGEPEVGGTEVTDDGRLVVNIDGLVTENEGVKTVSDVPPGTEFTIYMPNGAVISTSDPDGAAVVSISDGKAVITFDPDKLKDEDLKQALKELINIGSSNYAVTATEKDKHESDKAVFGAYRTNYYTSGVELNYTNNLANRSYRSGMLPLRAGTKLEDLSTYIDFTGYTELTDTVGVRAEPTPMPADATPSPTPEPAEKAVETTYNGRTGTEKGRLQQAKVEAWKLLNADGTEMTVASDDGMTTSPADTLPEEGTTCYLEGTLQTYTYSDYGIVTAGSESYKVRLKITTQAAAVYNEKVQVLAGETPYGQNEGENKIFDFNKLTLHYTPDETPSQVFTLKNIGGSPISGLNVHIVNSDTSGEEDADKYITNAAKSFVIMQQPKSEVDTDRFTEFTIRAKHDLPEGKHRAAIVVSSDNTEILCTYDVLIEVTNEKTYWVRVKSADETMGQARLSTGAEMAKYTKDTEVKIVVTPEEDYKISSVMRQEEEKDPMPVTRDQDSDNTYTVTVGERNMDVTAYFEPMPEANLHIVDLKFFDIDDNELLPLQIYNSGNDRYEDIEFRPTKSEYYLTVKSTVDLVKAEFRPKDNMTFVGENPITTEEKLSTRGGTTSLTPMLEYNDDGSAQYYKYYVKAFKAEPMTLSKDKDTGEITTNYNTTDLQIIRRYTDGTTYKDDKGEEHLKYYEKTYTIHIRRRPEVTVSLNPGNSPFGLIARTYPNDAASKSGAEDKFRQIHTFRQDENIQENQRVPLPRDLDDTNERDSGYISALYTIHAWDEHKYDDVDVPEGEALPLINLDEDESALFVYEGLDMSRLIDPGWVNGSLKNSVGEAVQQLSFSITVDTMPSAYTGGSIIDYYNSAASQTVPATRTLSELGEEGKKPYTGFDTLHIRPGRYKIEYTFTDADGLDTCFERSIVILPAPGNVKLGLANGGELTDVDYGVFRDYNSGGLTQELLIPPASEWSRLLRYRVMDVNMDIHVNQIDAREVKKVVDNTGAAAADRVIPGIYKPLHQLQ